MMGGSFTARTVMVNSRSNESIPPLAVPPLSRRRRTKRAVPNAFVRAWKRNVPSGETVGVCAKRLGALPVTRNGELVGVISERDYARKVILLGRSSAETPVWQIMSSPVVTVGPGDDVRQCMQVMTEKRIRHLPVLENGRMVGVISIGDLVRAVIEEQEHTIEQLERFISG